LKQALVSIFLHCKVVKKQEYYEKSGGKASAERFRCARKTGAFGYFGFVFYPLKVPILWHSMMKPCYDKNHDGPSGMFMF